MEENQCCSSSSQCQADKPSFGPEPPPAHKATPEEEFLSGKGKGKGLSKGGKGYGKGKGKGKGKVDSAELALEEIGVEKKVLVEAAQTEFSRPKALDEVDIHYVGTLVDGGTEFISTAARDPEKFILNSGRVPKGIEIGIGTMRKGEKAEFVLPAEAAFGEAGKEGVPSNAAVRFEVELISWVVRHDLCGDEQYIKRILSEGSGFVRPRENDEVLVSYRACSDSGQVVGQEACEVEYKVGSGTAGELATVLDKALTSMKRGEKSNVACACGTLSSTEASELVVELHQVYEIMDISPWASKLRKKQIRHGEGHESPKDAWKVSLVIQGASDFSGLVLLSSAKQVDFEVGNGDVCDALEFFIVYMKRNERAILTCNDEGLCQGLRKDLGYEDDSRKMELPITVTIELCNFEKPKDSWTMSDEEKLALAVERKEMGASLFRQGRSRLALERYKRVLELVGYHEGFKDENKPRALELQRACELNKAACALRLSDWTMAKASSEWVLKDSPNNVKALYRRAAALVELGEFDKALRDCKKVLELDEKNVETRQIMKKAQAGIRSERSSQRAVYEKMARGLKQANSGAEEEADMENNSNGTESPSGVEGASRAQQEATNAKPERNPDNDLGPGRRVRVEGLCARPDLNGSLGKVVSWDTDEQRWRVLLDSGQGICSKPSNLVLIADDTPKAQEEPARVPFGPPPPPGM